MHRLQPVEGRVAETIGKRSRSASTSARDAEIPVDAGRFFVDPATDIQYCHGTRMRTDDVTHERQPAMLFLAITVFAIIDDL